MAIKCSRKQPCKRGECRKCTASGAYVNDVVAAYPEGLTQVQVAALLGVSQPRIVHIETRALAKLRAALAAEREQ